MKRKTRMELDNHKERSRHTNPNDLSDSWTEKLIREFNKSKKNKE